jgi:hypothetical protein
MACYFFSDISPSLLHGGLCLLQNRLVSNGLELRILVALGWSELPAVSTTVCDQSRDASYIIRFSRSEFSIGLYLLIHCCHLGSGQKGALSHNSRGKPFRNFSALRLTSSTPVFIFKVCSGSIARVLWLRLSGGSRCFALPTDKGL